MWRNWSLGKLYFQRSFPNTEVFVCCLCRHSAWACWKECERSVVLHVQLNQFSLIRLHFLPLKICWRTMHSKSEHERVRESNRERSAVYSIICLYPKPWRDYLRILYVGVWFLFFQAQQSNLVQVARSLGRAVPLSPQLIFTPTATVAAVQSESSTQSSGQQSASSQVQYYYLNSIG